MRRACLAILVALLLGLAGLTATAQAGGPIPPRVDPRTGARAGSPLDARVRELAQQLRCPVCQNLSIWDSPAGVAATMRARVRELAGQGASDAQVRKYFVARYGEWILLAPPRHGLALAVWLAPLAILSLGAILALAALRRWRRRASATAVLDPAALAGARARLERLERELPPA